MNGDVRFHLHANGAAILAAAVVFYARSDHSWGLFAAVIFAPDLFMLGYLIGPSAGARIYNAGHSLFIPAGCIALGELLGVPAAVAVGIIWTAHIGLDQLFGYGYKYPQGFKVTHLSRV